jgi:hypothetical protein
MPLRASITKKAPEPVPEEIRRAASALGKLGAVKGGQARAASMTPSQRTRLAKKAARARWSKKEAK